MAAGESLDEAGKSRFFSNNPMSLYYKLPLVNRLHWYWRYIWHKHGVVSPVVVVKVVMMKSPAGGDVCGVL